MLILLEGAVLCLVFTALIVPFTLKNPTASIGDYPPAIRKRCAELGIFPARSRRFTKKDLLRKGTAALIFALIAAVVLRQLNGAERLLGRISGQLSNLAHRGLVRRAGAGLPVVLPLQSRPHPRHRGDGGIPRLPLSPPPVLHRDAARAPRLRGGRGADGPARNDIAVTATIHLT